MWSKSEFTWGILYSSKGDLNCMTVLIVYFLFQIWETNEKTWLLDSVCSDHTESRFPASVMRKSCPAFLPEVGHLTNVSIEAVTILDSDKWEAKNINVSG